MHGISVGPGSAWAGFETLTTRADCPCSLAARRTISGWPTTSGRQNACTTGSLHARTTTSGPMPVGSPSVIAMRGRSITAILVVACSWTKWQEGRSNAAPPVECLLFSGDCRVNRIFLTLAWFALAMMAATLMAGLVIEDLHTDHSPDMLRWATVHRLM